MILADASVWVDHLRSPDERLSRSLTKFEVRGHPYLTGEIALGSLSSRSVIIAELNRLLQLPVVRHAEVMRMIERYTLFSTGVGYVDIHLLASVLISPPVKFWTRDKRLHAQAERLGVAAQVYDA